MNSVETTLFHGSGAWTALSEKSEKSLKGSVYPSSRSLSQWLPRRTLLEDPELLPRRIWLLTQYQFREMIIKNLNLPTATARRGLR